MGQIETVALMLAFTILCIKQIASIIGNLLCNTGSAVWCSVMTSRGGRRKAGGRSKREGIYVYK